MEQRRRFERVRYSERIQVIVDGLTRHCGLVNISHGGLRLHQYLNLRPGQEIKVFVPLPIPFRARHRFCCFDGRVAWSTGDGAGVQFDDVSLEVFAQLELGIEALTEEPN